MQAIAMTCLPLPPVQSARPAGGPLACRTDRRPAWLEQAAGLGAEACRPVRQQQRIAQAGENFAGDELADRRCQRDAGMADREIEPSLCPRRTDNGEALRRHGPVADLVAVERRGRCPPLQQSLCRPVKTPWAVASASAPGSVPPKSAPASRQPSSNWRTCISGAMTRPFSNLRQRVGRHQQARRRPTSAPSIPARGGQCRRWAPAAMTTMIGGKAARRT